MQANSSTYRPLRSFQRWGMLSALAATLTMASSVAAQQPRIERTPGDMWPMFRGNPEQTGLTTAKLPKSMTRAWTFSANEPFSGSAAILNGVVYVGNEDGFLYALDLESGAVRWKYQAAEAIKSSPTAAHGAIYFGDESGKLHAVEATTGTARWTFTTEGPVVSSVNVAGDRLVFGSYDGSLYCLSAKDGALVWKYSTADRLHATPAIVGEFALIAGCDGQLQVVKLADGKSAGAVQLGAVSGSSPCVVGNRLFVGTHGNEVLAIDWQKREVAWRYAHPEKAFPFLASPAASGSLVLIAGRDKCLRALDAATGESKWEFATPARIDSSPVVAGSRAYFGGGDGQIYAVELATGQKAWSFEAGGGFTASPTIANGRLVIGNDEGVLFCLGEGPASTPNPSAEPGKQSPPPAATAEPAP